MVPSTHRDDRFGVERGKVFPAAEAAMLERRARRLVQSPHRIVRRMGLRPTDRVLELGCGPGFFSAELARPLTDGLLVVFDLQREMLLRARTKVASPALQADATRLPFVSSTFDVVFASAVLGEVPDAGGCIREISRVLAPGGRLAVSEIRGDDDFIPIGALRALLAPGSFVLAEQRRTPWSYVATFRVADPAASSSAEASL